ncbi:MAG: hypothetical protein JL50_05090 [Peptococcaceae bacterium BICA1-7]|nr:MAG: hypothetical protein JL50_05090 [Peptococcaceae bacterium BICA1-7]
MLAIIDLGRALTSNGRMGTIGIVLMNILVQSNSQLPGAIEFIDVYAITFQSPEKPFSSNIIQGLTLAIHRDFNSIGL